MNLFVFLEEIKGIALNGLYYSTNEHDKLRYQKLLELSEEKLSESIDVDIDSIRKNFHSEKGFVTPKVGVNAAVFKDRFLLTTLRKDDNCWELPGGWAELGESPRDTLVRELKEETSIIIKPLNIIDVITRFPGDFSQTYTSYHLLINSEYVSGQFLPSSETLDLKFINESEISLLTWHRDHQSMAIKAFESINAR